jgi:hypothetical protein
MTLDTQNKSFTLDNTFGRTYIAVMRMLRIDSFKDENSFKNFLRQVRSEIESARDSSLFDSDSTYALGGFDVQVATAGVAGKYIIVTLGGSVSPSIVEDTDPLKGFGVILSRMLNSYFDKEYVLSEEPKPGEVPYQIQALQLDQSIVIDSFNRDFQQYHAINQKNIVKGKSPLFDYGHDNSDIFWDYYFFDTLGDLVEVTFNVAQIVLENANSVPVLDFAEPTMNILPDILAADPAVITETVTSTDVGFFENITDFFSNIFEDCSAPDLDCDGSPGCDAAPDCDVSGCDVGGCDCNFS